MSEVLDNVDAKTSETNEDVNITQESPEILNKEPENKKNDEITCAELFEKLNQNNGKKILVIDVRNSDEYSKSRISFDQYMIHIPAEKIQPNKVPGYYRYLLLDDAEAEKRFSRRSSRFTDCIVLVDSNSSFDTMKNDSPIALFKYCLEEYDVHIDYKRIAVLKGGFEEWRTTHPEHVTNHLNNN